ncbi:MAG: ribbon-helix-helix domain-containing protein [Leptolyngbya sp. IPPAS B-1204]|nr:MAG: ribbon-helix-helix protein, CopG family [Leptolyngbya sp. IPPAS B-1204]
MATDKDRLTVYLPSELRERISQLAEQDKRSVSATIEILLLKALEAMDKEQREKSE